MKYASKKLQKNIKESLGHPHKTSNYITALDA